MSTPPDRTSHGASLGLNSGARTCSFAKRRSLPVRSWSSSNASAQQVLGGTPALSTETSVPPCVRVGCIRAMAPRGSVRAGHGNAAVPGSTTLQLGDASLNPALVARRQALTALVAPSGPLAELNASAASANVAPVQRMRIAPAVAALAVLAGTGTASAATRTFAARIGPIKMNACEDAPGERRRAGPAHQRARHGDARARRRRRGAARWPQQRVMLHHVFFVNYGRFPGYCRGPGKCRLA